MTLKSRLVPLSLPLDSPNLRILHSLRSHEAQIQTRLNALKKLDEQLNEVGEETYWDAIIPVPESSRLGYTKGQIVNTNTVIINLGGTDLGNERDSGYWIEYTATQARAVANRRREGLQAKLHRIQKAIKDAQNSLSADLGYTGGKVNDKNELINEEGLPFIDIQEYDEEDAIGPEEPTSKEAKPSEQRTLAANVTPVVLTPQAPKNDSNREATKPAIAALRIKETTSLSPSSAENAPGKKVSFAEPKSEASMDKRKSGLVRSPIMKTSSDSNSSSTASSLKPQIFERPIRSIITEKDVTKPPPVLTAAEKSARKQTPLRKSDMSDGVASTSRKVDLSAYLPKSLRESNIIRPAKLKGSIGIRDINEIVGLNSNHETQSDASDVEDAEEAEDGEESDGLFDYAYSDDYGDDDDDEDDVHIDDALAMREAALEYHAKRYDLGAGAGMGPLGGQGRHDEYDEPGLSMEDKGGLPFVETYEDEEADGRRRPSKFRTGRLQTARMVIPDLNPGSINISDEILPGDSLGPFEGPSGGPETGMGEMDEDFTGMSQQEVQTFLRYVKALETGEQLEDIQIIPASSTDRIQLEESVPPAIQPAARTSNKVTVVENPTTNVFLEEAVNRDIKPDVRKQLEVNMQKPSDQEKPKRVSKFRAANARNV